MKALVLHAVGDLRYDDVQLPKRESDEVTVFLVLSLMHIINI